MSSKTEETQSIRILTAEGVNVAARIKDGRTRLFFEQSEAKKHADQRRSYTYPAFDVKSNLVGYCVPN